MLKVYGHPVSQPSQAVIWVCVINRLPIELHPDPRGVADVNPRGQMPAIDDDGFVLSEMPAILSYLAEKNGWKDFYPSDLQARGRINSYLHAHHCLTRLCSMKLMAPYVHVAFGGPQSGNPLSYVMNTCIQESMSNEESLAEGQALVEQIIDYIEEEYLQDQTFIAATDQASIADVACYEEISQLVTAKLVDFSGRENISRWMERMQQLPHHDALHAFNFVLGDIATKPNTMERYFAAAEASTTELLKLDDVVLV